MYFVRKVPWHRQAALTLMRSTFIRSVLVVPAPLYLTNVVGRPVLLSYSGSSSSLLPLVKRSQHLRKVPAPTGRKEPSPLDTPMLILTNKARSL
jgi:hypothetical protein